MLRLFNKDDCPFCWKVRIALAETKTDYELITLGPDDDHSALERFSPSATTPVLVNGDGSIWESAVIVEYVNELASNALLCGSRAERARARLLHSFADGHIGPHLREVVFEKRSKPKVDWDLERITKGEAGWRTCLDWLETMLRGHDFFLGQFSIAECALYPRFALAERFGVGVDGRHPGLLAWYVGLQARTSCRDTQPINWRNA